MNKGRSRTTIQAKAKLALFASLMLVAVALRVYAADGKTTDKQAHELIWGTNADGFRENYYKRLLKNGEKRDALLLRIRWLEPHRRDDPLRYENITDDEVREVQAAAEEILPRDYVSINGVVVGCACEDGLQCKSQVWIMARRNGKATGLLLSKIGDHWTIGPVQRWFLRYRYLLRRDLRTNEYLQFRHMNEDKDEQKLIDQFPTCEAEQPPRGQLPTSRAPR